MTTKFFAKRDTFTLFLIPPHPSAQPSALISARLFLRVTLPILLSLFTIVRLFPRHGTFIFSPILCSTFLSLSLSSRDYEVFFPPETRRPFYLSLRLQCAFFLSRHDTFTFFFFFLRIEDASSAVFSLEGAFRESRLRKYPHRGERHDGRGRKEKYECPCRVHAILKGFPFTGSVSDLRKARARVSIAVAIPPGRLAKVTD